MTGDSCSRLIIYVRDTRGSRTLLNYRFAHSIALKKHVHREQILSSLPDELHSAMQKTVSNDSNTMPYHPQLP